jgi:hypothetical protein
MTSVILRALFHIGESPSCPYGEIVGVFEGFLFALAEKMTSREESVLGKFQKVLFSDDSLTVRWLPQRPH